jgi:predicted dehydrogenase
VTRLPGETLRWGFVGTGRIARWMAAVVREAPGAELTAVASRRMHTAEAFALEHGGARAFGSWSDMLAWEGIDAVYVATPTGRREEICVAAACSGKHVLGEKPFASLPSLQRITAACRAQEVAFMDATHFVHHPRHAAVQERLQTARRPLSLHSSFLVSLTDRADIRYDPSLEPLGAIGDLGWYNMRATLEYLDGAAALESVTARLRRDDGTGTIVAGEGVLRFADGSTSEWRCGFDATALDIGLQLGMPTGTLRMGNFVGEETDHSALFGWTDAHADTGTTETIRVESSLSGPALMFRDFVEAAGDPAARERWMRAGEETQALVDAVLEAAGR